MVIALNRHTHDTNFHTRVHQQAGRFEHDYSGPYFQLKTQTNKPDSLQIDKQGTSTPTNTNHNKQTNKQRDCV